MSAPLRMAVIGAGRMGRFHAQKIKAEGRAELCAVVDRAPQKAQALAAELNAPAAVVAADVAALTRAPHRCAAAVIATPTSTHAEVATRALHAGLDVLLEKPIAENIQQAEALLQLARARGRVLQVGHVEWFNPAMQAARAHILAPRFLEAQRIGPFNPRAAKTDAVLDLMIHDLDIIQQLAGGEPARVEAAGAAVLSAQTDIAGARLTFANGALANVAANRCAPKQRRKLHVFQPGAYLALDYDAQSAAITRLQNGELQTQTLAAPRDEDALHLQLRAFLQAVQKRRAEFCSGEQALAALQSALRVKAAIAQNAEQRG